MKPLLSFFVAVSVLCTVIPAFAAPASLSFRCISLRGEDHLVGSLTASNEAGELDVLTVSEKTTEKKIKNSDTEFESQGFVKYRIANEKTIFQDKSYGIFPLGTYEVEYSKRKRSLSLLVEQYVLVTGNIVTRFMLEQVSGSEKTLVELYCN
jgi:hypothetical protein